jgi:hypothetical protein
VVKNNSRMMVIRFVDGTEKVLEHDRLPQDDANLASRIREALNAQHLILEVDNKMVVYPFHNIKEIEVFPVPERLPGLAIRKARSVS